MRDSAAAAVEAVRMLDGGRRVRFSNLDKAFFPATEQHRALTKADLILYYHEVRDAVLPYLRNRPLVLRRYPDGIAGDWFYQKDWPDREQIPDFADSLRVYSDSRGETLRYLLCPGWDCLLWLPQLGCIDLHPWLSRVASADACGDAHGLADAACGLDHPDQLVIDLDPYVAAGRRGAKGTEAGGEPGLDPEDWAAAVEVALWTRELLADLGLEGFVKTSGKRGLHIYVPLDPALPYEQVRAFAKGLGARLVLRHFDAVTLKYDLRSRSGKVFFDYNQNVRGKTLASAFSVRPTPEATVSMPLPWSDVARARPEDFTMATVPGLLRERGDPWRGLPERQRLPALPSAR